jgi:hypothetical protein
VPITNKVGCELESLSWQGVLDTTLRDKVCQWLAAGLWFSLEIEGNNRIHWQFKVHYNTCQGCVWLAIWWVRIRVFNATFSNISVSTGSSELNWNHLQWTATNQQLESTTPNHRLNVCLYTYEFWLSLCKIVRSSVILLLPLFSIQHRQSFFSIYHIYL